MSYNFRSGFHWHDYVICAVGFESGKLKLSLSVFLFSIGGFTEFNLS